MCVDMVAVRHAASAAAGTPGDIADTNYMLVPWPEMCDAGAAAAVAAGTAVSPEHTRGRGRSGSGDGAGGRNVRQRVSPAAVRAPTVRLPKMHRIALVASTGALAQTFAQSINPSVGQTLALSPSRSQPNLWTSYSMETASNASTVGRPSYAHTYCVHTG